MTLKWLKFCRPLLRKKPVLKNAKLALTLNVGLSRVRQTSYSPEAHPKPLSPRTLSPPISSYKANLHACSAIIYRTVASFGTY